MPHSSIITTTPSSHLAYGSPSHSNKLKRSLEFDFEKHFISGCHESRKARNFNLAKSQGLGVECWRITYKLCHHLEWNTQVRNISIIGCLLRCKVQTFNLETQTSRNMVKS